VAPLLPVPFPPGRCAQTGEPVGFAYAGRPRPIGLGLARDPRGRGPLQDLLDPIIDALEVVQGKLQASPIRFLQDGRTGDERLVELSFGAKNRREGPLEAPQGGILTAGPDGIEPVEGPVQVDQGAVEAGEAGVEPAPGQDLETLRAPASILQDLQLGAAPTSPGRVVR
jgi:hypothetical protein